MPGLTRRSFLSGAAAAAGWAAYSAALGTKRVEAQEQPQAVITEVETYVYNYPTVGRFKFFEDLQGRPVGRPTVVVRLRTQDGQQGWGQAVPTPRWSYETTETVQTTIERYIGPLLIGQDPFDIDGLHARMEQIIAPAFTTGQPICKAGVDLALQDLTGRILNQSLPKRWDKTPAKKITLSWTLNPLTLDDIEGLIQEGRERGYQNFNVKVSPDLKFDVEMCRKVKQMVPNGFLWADANGGYDEETAVQAVKQLADAGVNVLEQPLRPNHITGYQRLKKIAALPILMDEGVISPTDLQEFIKLEMLDGVAMKPARCGGLTSAKRQIEILQERGLMFLGSGLTDPDLSLAASLVLYGAFDLKYPAALNGPQFLAGESLLKNPLKVEDGTIAVPEGPGLGVDVDLNRLLRTGPDSTP